MIRLLIFLLLGYIGYRVVKALMAPKPAVSVSPARNSEETVQDPVCGTYVAKADAIVGKLGDERHYFCSMACLEKFREQLDHTTPPH